MDFHAWANFSFKKKKTKTRANPKGFLQRKPGDSSEGWIKNGPGSRVQQEIQ